MVISRNIVRFVNVYICIWTRPLIEIQCKYIRFTSLNFVRATTFTAFFYLINKKKNFYTKAK